MEANGENEHPVFKFLKKALPQPSDDAESLMANPQFFIWKPVKRTDIAWNFEKFLIGPDGTPIKRYSRFVSTFIIPYYIFENFRNFLTANIADDIAELV